MKELQAVDKSGNLTATGKQLARLPVDPRLGRILLAAGRLGCVSEILIIISALSGQDPRERPLDVQEKADVAHAQFVDERSDFLFYLNVWHFYHEQARHLSHNRLRKMCQQKFLSYIRIREWKEIYQQLQELLADMQIYINAEPANNVGPCSRKNGRQTIYRRQGHQVEHFSWFRPVWKIAKMDCCG